MIKLTSQRIPKYFKLFRTIDPIVLRNNPKNNRAEFLNLWEFVMNELRLNGIYRKTYSNRLYQSTEYLYYLVKRESGTNSFLDVGASDGSTSFYTHTYLKNKGINIKTVSTDKYTTLFYSRDFFFRYYFTEDYVPILCIVMNRFSIHLYKHIDLISNLLAKRLIIEFNNRKLLLRKYVFDLIHPEIITDDLFRYESLDVFKINHKYLNKFNIIRCSNLLQLSYFDKSQIINAIKLLQLYLMDNGFLIITRIESNDMEESGVVLQKNSKVLRIIHRFTSNSEIETIITEN